MMKSSIYAGLLAGTALLAAGPALSQDIFDGPVRTQLSDQDINPNETYLKILREAAKGGPDFKFSEQRLKLEMETGQRGRVGLNVTNAGNKDGTIKNISILGSIPSVELDTNCEEVLKADDYCEITVSYTAETARDVSFAIIGELDEPGFEAFEIPVMITVNEPAPPPVTTITPVTVAPEVKAVTPRERGQSIARAYFGRMGMSGSMRPAQKGFTIISAAKDPQSSTEIAGVSYQDVRIERVTSDERYSKDIPYTDASLQVDRDRILTTDRVIKAVLETPVSNVMCNKVVAMVESDVYSATGTKPLIQAGSRVIGECQSFVDERVGVAWNRIITTDGRSIAFQNRMADTRDATGLGGAVGRIYMSPFDRYVLPIVSTMIDAGAGVIYAAFGEDEEVLYDDNGNVVSGSSATNEGLRIVTGEARGTAQQIITDIRDTREIAVIPKGSRIDIEIMEDIYFRDDRKVVSLADMTFNLDEIEVGTADRDLPQELTLVPVSTEYSGASVVVNGRRYRLDTARGADAPARVIPEISETTLSDLRAASAPAE